MRANLSNYIKILPSGDVATDEELIRLVQEKSERSQFGVSQVTVERKKEKGTAKGKAAAPQARFTRAHAIPRPLSHSLPALRSACSV